MQTGLPRCNSHTRQIKSLAIHQRAINPTWGIDLRTGLTYRFDDFEIQPDEHRLLVGGAPTALGARAFSLLLALVEHAGHLVTKDALLERVWPDVVVEENNLQVQISTLRKLLGPDAIATVVGQGYRFIPELLIKAPGVALGQHNSRYKQSNLPHHLSALIGREQDLVQLHALLPLERLVTVTGSGGVGKTRLMIACAQEIENRFNAGAWLIELANQSDPQMVPVAVAASLSIEVKDASSATEAIARFVRDKQILLLLDNCEHLVGAVASLVESLLAIAPQLQVMASSQEILGLAGEQVFRVPSLLLPPDEIISAEAALTYGAIKLFTERAQSGESNFRCNDDNAPVITAICRRLDGIPLAIEMAAARVSSLGLDSVAQLLDERFLALTAGRRSAVPRQRTLQATLDWSFGLLAPRERLVFRRLAGFVGGFSLAAAIAVGSDADLDQNEVIDAVSILVSKSLLTVDTSQGQWRYRLLETARTYALERLAESGETNDVARRAAEHYVVVFRSCFDDWTRLSDESFDARYAPDLDNLRLAMDWSFGPHGDAQIGLLLTGLSGSLWVGPLMISESERRFATAFARVEPHTPPTIVAALHLAAGSFYFWRFNEQSIAALRTAGNLLRELGETTSAGYALLLLGNTLAAIGDEGAQETLVEAQALLADCDRPRVLALLPKTLAMFYYMRGMAAETVRENLRALELARAGGYEILALTVEENLADSLWLAGDLPQALAAARNVVELCKQVKVSHKITWGWVYGNLFGILTESGELAEALEIGRLAMPYLREANSVAILIDHYTLRVAKAGHLVVAARLHGWINAYFLSKRRARQPNELRAMNSAAKILREHLAPDVLAQLCAEGALLSEPEICNLALT